MITMWTSIQKLGYRRCGTHFPIVQLSLLSEIFCQGRQNVHESKHYLCNELSSSKACRSEMLIRKLGIDYVVAILEIVHHRNSLFSLHERKLCL